jgi:hypothetical protein
VIFHSAKYRSEFLEGIPKDYLVPRKDGRNSFQSNIKKSLALCRGSRAPHGSLVRPSFGIGRYLKACEDHLLIAPTRGKNLQARARIDFVQLLSAYSSLRSTPPSWTAAAQEISSVDYKVQRRPQCLRSSPSQASTTSFQSIHKFDRVLHFCEDRPQILHSAQLT